MGWNADIYWLSTIPYSSVFSAWKENKWRSVFSSFLQLVHLEGYFVFHALLLEVIFAISVFLRVYKVVIGLDLWWNYKLIELAGIVDQ